MKVGLNVGSSPVDMNQVVISITDATTTNNLIYGANSKTYGSAMVDFAAGATAAVNLEKLLDSTGGPGSNGKYFYTIGKIRDEDGSFSQGEPVMNTGDLVTVYLSTVAVGDTSYPTIGTTTTSGGQEVTGLVVGPRSSVSIVMTPEAGAATTADFFTPSSYGVKETVQLYP
jgi:flagellin FlaB